MHASVHACGAHCSLCAPTWVHRVIQRVPPTRGVVVSKPDSDEAPDRAARRRECRLEDLGAAAECTVGWVVGVPGWVASPLRRCSECYARSALALAGSHSPEKGGREMPVVRLVACGGRHVWAVDTPPTQAAAFG